MTKTQALQRLYKALTGNEGRNTGSKVIEDLAIAAENGEIGGGGKVAAVTFVLGEGVYSVSYTAPIIREINGKQYVVAESGIPMAAGGTISVPVYTDGTIIGVATDYKVSVSGEATALEDSYYLISGDCSFEITDEGGK